LVEDLALHLGRGETVGAALAAARRERIRSGAHTAAWAGLVVLGDADLVPVPGGWWNRTRLAGLLAAALLVLLAVLVLVLVRRPGASRPR